MTNRKKKWKEYLWLNLSMAKGCYGGIIFSALASCLFLWLDIYAVSYTHLDVYKRQQMRTPQIFFADLIFSYNLFYINVLK